MDILTIENIKLNQHFTTKESAIRAAGEVLVLAGYVEADYVAAMVQRENDVTTYMGNFIAIPHGTDEAKKYIKKSGISIIQVPNGVDFGTPEEEKMVTVLFGIAESKTNTWIFCHKLLFFVLILTMLSNWLVHKRQKKSWLYFRRWIK